MRVNMNKTKVVISGECQKQLQKSVRWPCGVCGRGVGSNSVQCTSCQKLVHKKCGGIKHSMSKVMKSFMCRGCLNPVTSICITDFVNICCKPLCVCVFFNASLHPLQYYYFTEWRKVQMQYADDGCIFNTVKRSVLVNDFVRIGIFEVVICFDVRILISTVLCLSLIHI